MVRRELKYLESMREYGQQILRARAENADEPIEWEWARVIGGDVPEVPRACRDLGRDPR